MNLLPFGKLPAHKPRNFVPPTLDLGDWPQIAPLFDRLEKRAAQCQSTAELERWLLDWSELTAALDEESSRRYIAMTCHTDNAEAEKAYLHFVENVEPQLKPRQFALEKIYSPSAKGRVPRAQIAESAGLASSSLRCRYFVFDRDVKNHVDLFRPENVALETEEAKLCQQYQKMTGSLTVNFRGEEKTLVQMGRYLEEPDRALRQEAWELVARRRLQEAEKFEDIFDRLIDLREQIARNAGFKNYRDYAFRRLGRFDYTPEDCAHFHDAVEREVMPVVREFQADRRRQLGLDKLHPGHLRPWDLAVDPQNRPPLKPFTGWSKWFRARRKFSTGWMANWRAVSGRCRTCVCSTSTIARARRRAATSRTLSEARVPFIFMNAVGQQRDVETILHEAGHAFHALAARGRGFVCLSQRAD